MCGTEISLDLHRNEQRTYHGHRRCQSVPEPRIRRSNRSYHRNQAQGRSVEPIDEETKERFVRVGAERDMVTYVDRCFQSTSVQDLDEPLSDQRENKETGVKRKLDNRGNVERPSAVKKAKYIK